MNRKKISLLLLLSTLLVMILATAFCLGRDASQEAPEPLGMFAMEESKAVASADDPGDSMRRRSPAPSVVRNLEKPNLRAEPEPTEATPEPVARKVHYNGYLKVKVGNPRQSVQQAAELVAEYGGFVERLTGSGATLRVPVASFREIMAKIEGYGDVLQRSMTAQDVTDAYLSVELRNKTLKASRKRLIALLAASRDATEKLRLLQEIKRLTQQIDQLELQLTTLASLANFSRLTVDFEARSREAHSPAQEPIASFRWIHSLSPFRRDVAFTGRKPDLKVPVGFVALSDQKHWIAESADGAVIWSAVLGNRPHGSTEFWLDAIQQRLAREYASAETTEIGGFKVLRLVDQSEQAYRYLVGVRAQGDKLQLLEIYYPSAEQEERYGDAVATALQGGQA